ncbi:MAG: lytic transglycosylase domain-containing protein [Myxococcales bacterium]
MVRILLISVFLAALPAAARSGLHMWTDKDGVLHVDDTPPPPPRARNAPRKATPAPAAPARKAERWWEKRSDAPPDEIDRAAAYYNVPAELVRAVIWAESAGDAMAVSRTGALGLMQLMPHTAGEMYVQDPVDPAQNIMGGTRYLRWLANQFGGDMLLTLAAYNAGPDAVKKYGGVPPFEETRTYCKRVMAYYRQLKAESAQKKLASNREPKE